MRKSRFSEEQKIGTLRQVRTGITLKAVCAQTIAGQSLSRVEGQVWDDGSKRSAAAARFGGGVCPVAPSGDGALGAKSDPEGSERNKWRRKRLDW